MKLDPFDPTPKLRFSPVPISFVSFNEYDKNVFVVVIHILIRLLEIDLLTR